MEIKEKLVSIIFITHNREEELCRALKSCFMQTWENIEYIIIDNASQKDIEKEIDELFIQNKINNSYKYIYVNENLGVAEGRNYGLSFSNGNYSFFLDDDAILIDKNTITKIINDFENNDDVAAIACKIYQPIDNSYLLPIKSKRDKKSVLTYLGGAHAIKNCLWENMALYPKELKFGSEELYASLNIHKMNLKIFYDSNIMVNHLPSCINRKIGKDRKLDIILNIYIIRKYYYPQVIQPILFLTLFIHLFKNGLFNIIKIFQKYRERYNKNNINKMTQTQFIKLVKDFGLRSLL